LSWSQEDRDKLKAAILALSCGEMVRTVVYEGPPRREVEYQQANLPEMRKLLTEMEGSVGLTPRTKLAKFRKGFR